MYITYTTMSLITTLSVKEEYKNEYYSMRNWLKQRNMSMGDYIIGKWNDEFQSKIDGVLTK
jgi:hypothetical protein